jgi:CRP-like cAMP-binding protein
LGAHEVFRYLSPRQIDAISSAAEVITRAAGDTVYYMGTPATHVYVLLHGQVALRLPGREGVSLLIDQLDAGALFGSCLCVDLDTYYLTAQCLTEVELMRVEAALLRRLMEEDLPMGFALQTHISKIYFKRYVDTMKKLQSIVMCMPLEGA